MLNNQLIREYFGQDKDHFALCEFVLGKGAKVLYAENDGLLMFYAGIHIAFGGKSTGIEKMLDLIESSNCFVCSNESERQAVMKKFKNFSKSKPCYQILYREPYGVKIPENTEVKILPPTDENIDFVTSTYTLGFAREDIKRLMTDFSFFATYTNGEISGYIGRHDEGSIGLLEIMPKFRRMGLGAFLVDYSVKTLLQNGEIAYCNIETSNQKSLNMHLKMGFVPSDKLVYWCS